MDLATELELNENEVVGLMNETCIEEYLEEYLHIKDHDAFNTYVRENAAHQIIFEAMTGQFAGYPNSLAQSFLLGFLMGYNFHERCLKS